MSGPLPGRPTVIETARLVLRAPCTEDAHAVAEGLRDHAVARMLARVPQPYDLQEARDWLSRIGRPGADSRHLAITADGPLVGVVGIERRTGGLHLGYWLARAHWGRGMMSEAVEAVLARHFADRPQDRLHSGVFVDNPASLRIQAKLGFAVIGRSDVFSRARGEMVAHLDTAVTAAAFTSRPGTGQADARPRPSGARGKGLGPISRSGERRDLSGGGSAPSDPDRWLDA